MIALLIAVWLGMAVVMAIGWAFQWRVRNGGWTDVFWTFGMGLVGAGAALVPLEGRSTPTLRQLILAFLFAIWALRLGIYVAQRVLSSPQDARYGRLIAEWAPNAQKMMFGFLQVQAIAGALLLASVTIAARLARPGLNVRDGLGFAVLACAIIGEAAADAQLHRFKANPANRGKICDVGLWSWSRHPNYFFQWFGWLAYPIIAVDLSGHDLWGWITLSAPAYMYYLLRYVSGVPPLEAYMLVSRGAAFKAYQARVSLFFPSPPRRPAAATPPPPESA